MKKVMNTGELLEEGVPTCSGVFDGEQLRLLGILCRVDLFKETPGHSTEQLEFLTSDGVCAASNVPMLAGCAPLCVKANELEAGC